MARIKSTTPQLLAAANNPTPEAPTAGVQWADLMKVGLMPLLVPKQYGVGASVVYQTKAAKLLTCKVHSIVAESSDNKSHFVIVQLPPKEARATRTPEERLAAKAQEKVDLATMIAQAVAAAIKQQ